MRRLALSLVMALALSGPVLAVNPDEMLKDPVLEARARALSTQLRCMVCQNQSIDDSNAELAKDLRMIVREHIARGESDDAVISYLVSRYGEFVLLKPRVNSHTYVLWFAPLALVVIGAVSVFTLTRTRKTALGEVPLSAEEEARLKALATGDDA